MFIVKNRWHYYNLFLIVMLLIISACNKQEEGILEPDTKPELSRGQITGEPKFWMETPANYIQQMATLLNLDNSVVGNHVVKVYSINYKTIDKNGELIDASGTVYYPVGDESFPVLSYHHGTIFNRVEVASVNPLVNQQEAFLIASNGYVTFVPDYLGYGISTMMHPYHNESLSASVVVDFIRAGKSFCKDQGVNLNEKLFLGGYSEGGYVTLAVQKEIETNLSDEFFVAASAPLSGAYDLIETGKYYFNKEIISKPAFLAFLITSYNNVYEWNKLGDVFNSPYAEKMNSLFDGTHFDDDISSNLNDTVSVLLKQTFIDQFLSETTTEEKSKFIENSLLDWTPSSPIQFVHGDSDNIVPYINASNAFNTFKGNGADVRLVTVPGGTHETTILPSVIYTLQFFENYK